MLSLQDPFDADEFVEKLAWRATGGARQKGEDLDPMVLHAAFEKTIKDLKVKLNCIVVHNTDIHTLNILHFTTD